MVFFFGEEGRGLLGLFPEVILAFDVAIGGHLLFDVLRKVLDIVVVAISFIDIDFNIADLSFFRMERVTQLRKRTSLPLPRKRRVNHVLQVYE